MDKRVQSLAPEARVLYAISRTGRISFECLGVYYFPDYSLGRLQAIIRNMIQTGLITRQTFKFSETPKPHPKGRQTGTVYCLTEMGQKQCPTL